MGLLGIFKRRRKPLSDGERRAALLADGRLTDGTIIDTAIEGDDEVAFFTYSVAGTDFESSERLTIEQRNDPIRYAPGAKVGVRYDKKNHGNAIIV